VRLEVKRHHTLRIDLSERRKPHARRARTIKCWFVSKRRQSVSACVRAEPASVAGHRTACGKNCRAARPPKSTSSFRHNLAEAQADDVERVVLVEAPRPLRSLPRHLALVGGLQLRNRQRHAYFNVRRRPHEKQRRFDLGRAISGQEDTEAGICLATARDWAMKIKFLCRPEASPIDSAKHIAAWPCVTRNETLPGGGRVFEMEEE
jgi:hypothetical protein